MLKKILFFLLLFSFLGCSGNKSKSDVSKVKYFYTDLDGTFLKEGNSFSDTNLKAVKAFQKSGGQVGVATGRLPIHARSIAGEMKTILPIISANGAYIESNDGKQLRIKSIGRNSPVDALCKMITNSQCKMYYTAFVNIKSGKVNFQKGVCRLPGDGEGILKIRAKKCSIGSDLFKKSSDKFGNDFTIVESGHGEYKGVSFAIKGVDKGEAMEWVAKKLNLSMKKMAFIGDSGNDISGMLKMLKSGGTCYVMKNGTSKLKKTCKNITAHDNKNNGVGLVLKKLTN
jgi:hydroxymethylpyrimidine pyrophosphatase-like HAD family hydrolase